MCVFRWLYKNIFDLEHEHLEIDIEMKKITYMQVEISGEFSITEMAFELFDSSMNVDVLH